MNRRYFVAKSSIIAILITMILSAGLSAQDNAASPVAVISPSPWSTLRSDSITVSFQADLEMLPNKSVDFRVVRRSGARSTTLFTRNVKMEADNSADVFLGRSRDVPLGGTDYLAIEWSVPGTEHRGTVEPVGLVRLAGEIVDNAWVPARPALSAMRLQDGVPGEDAAAALAAGENGFEVGGARFAAGWNTESLFILFTPAAGVTGAEFAFDLKCGKNAFLSWADRFIVYSVEGDSIYGRHYNRGAVDVEGMKFEELRWGDGREREIAAIEAGSARLISVRWSELGAQTFDGRNIGFSVFVENRTRSRSASHPAAAARNIPGTWGDLKLAN
ncbi:MAG: hypothetical protein LBC70_05110 [Chitinispirillales bacterium]|jgi:hypothetical protein|nr:hypothetical protein [Chitinispirillales bacterium]